tara:strand:- start:492 stop:992 length:501 start_codon:yes stop_codon:yes gene_type:complete
MAITYEAIQTTTLGSAASSITFGSIAASWTDLRIVWTGTVTTSATRLQMQFNSDTATNYSGTYLYSGGGYFGSGRVTNQTYLRWNQDAQLSTTIPVMNTVDIFSYAGSTYKTCLISNINDLNGSGSVVPQVGLWRNTAAITSIVIYTLANTMAIGTTATLYGIKAA